MSNRATFVTRQIDAVRNLWRAEELVRGLTARNLRVKYKGSVLGFVFEAMMPAGFLASLLRGLGVATGPAEAQPEQLSGRV
jgi:hypothetical protein